MPIRTYYVEDNAVMREALAEYLELSDDIELCGMAVTTEEALEALEEARPDVIVVDLSLPGRSGIELVREVGARWGTPCLILSGHGERRYVGQALAAGARGYVLKGYPPDIPTAIRRVRAGGFFISASVREQLDYEPEVSGA